MPDLTFHSPRTVDQALALLGENAGARVLAGGTDLIVQMRSGRAAPSAVIDLKRIPELGGVRELPGGSFAIGAATRCTALKEHAGLASAWPGVVEAANLIGSVQVRNRATVTGNLCNASPAADSVPALVAAGAQCRVIGADGERTVAVEDIPAAPGRTTLMPAEFVAEIILPARPERGGDAYLRSIPRTEMDIAVAGVGVSLTLDADGACRAARIALGAVAPTVLLVREAAEALVGSRFEGAALARMEEAVRAACRPIDDKRGPAAYRIHMAGVMARRAVAIARTRAGEPA